MKNSYAHPGWQYGVQLTSLVLFTVLWVRSVLDVAFETTVARLTFIPVAIGVGLALADFVSGLVHWAADTWGSVKWPIIGPFFLLSFRNHHTAPKTICGHDYIQLMGDSCLVAIPVAFFLMSFSAVAFPLYALKLTILCMLLAIACTNPIHSWAHGKKTPKIAKFLQKLRIILPKDNHNMHHTMPFDDYYCITTGWLNPVLHKIQFFRKAETVITFLTGAKPRAEDTLGIKAIE